MKLQPAFHTTHLIQQEDIYLSRFKVNISERKQTAEWSLIFKAEPVIYCVTSLMRLILEVINSLRRSYVGGGHGRMGISLNCLSAAFML